MTHLEGSELTFASTIDEGEFEWQAEALVKSIHNIYPQANILLSVDSNPSFEIPDFIARRTQVKEVDQYIEDYAVSHQLQAFEQAAQEFETKYHVMIDTDTLLVNPIPTLELEADVYARPATGRLNHWNNADSESNWNEIFSYFDMEKPNMTLECPMGGPLPVPFWNAGFVITERDSYPQHLLETVDELSALQQEDEQFFRDQIAMTVLMKDYAYQALDTVYNYPLPANLTCPSDISVLHYGNKATLSRLANSTLREQIKEAGIPLPKSTIERIISTGLDYTSFQIGHRVPYSVHKALKRLN